MPLNIVSVFEASRLISTKTLLLNNYHFRQGKSPHGTKEGHVFKALEGKPSQQKQFPDF